MITIDEEKCKGCGTCAEICHEHCMRIESGKVKIVYDYCSTCTQCIAICPNLALSWDGVVATRFDPNRMPSPEQVRELFGERRTIRSFKETVLDRSLVEEIVGCGLFAPTHGHDFKIIAATDRNVLETIDGIVRQSTKRIYSILFKPKWIRNVILLCLPAFRGEYLRALAKLEYAEKAGKAYTSLPPVMIFIIGNKRTPLSLESAQYLLFSMHLYASARNIGFRILVGNQMFLNRNKRIRVALRLQKNERIYAMAGLGYAAREFRNKVLGRKLEIQWL